MRKKKRTKYEAMRKGENCEEKKHETKEMGVRKRERGRGRGRERDRDKND